MSVNVPVKQGGEVTYVLNVGMYAEALVPLLMGGELPPDWYAAIIDRRGITIARHPNPEEMIGRRAPRMVTMHSGGLREGWGEDRNLDGVEVYRAFFRSDLTGWTVAIGAPQALVDGPVNRVLNKLRRQCKFPALAHCVSGIEANIQERLRNLVLICLYGGVVPR